MTLAKAQTIVSQIIASGFKVDAYPINGDTTNWAVRAQTFAGEFGVDVQTAANLATSQGVTGKITSIEYT